MKRNLIDNFFVLSMVLAAVIGGGLTACFNTHPVPLPEPRIEVYDCVNIQYSPPIAWQNSEHPAYYAFQRLKYACEEQANAIALVHIWQTDPMAGVVLEPETIEQTP